MEKDLALSAIIGLGTGITLIFIFVFTPASIHFLLPVSAENTFQLDARFVYAHNGTNPCIKRPCFFPPTHYLAMRYQKPVYILEYSICDLDKIGTPSSMKTCITMPGELGVGEIGDDGYSYGWKYLGVKKGFEIGDVVNIRVKAAPLKIDIIDGEERWSYDEADAMWYNIGNSNILEVASMHDFTGRQQELYK